jgi:hypothetical protein
LLGGLAKTILVLGLVGSVVICNFGLKQIAEIEAVTMIRVFFDEAQTDELKQGGTFDWGEIGSGVWTLTLYVNNTGNTPVILGFNYGGDHLPRGLAEYWDYDGTPLAQNELRTVTITLVVPQHISPGVWEWDSSITAVPAHYDTMPCNNWMPS